MNNETNAALRKAIELLPLNESNASDFVDVVNGIVDAGDPAAIGPILQMIDDGWTITGIADAVLRQLEVFDTREYVRALVHVLPDFYDGAPFWCESEIKKLIWDSLDRAVLSDELRTAPQATKQVARAIAIQISREVPALQAAVDEVLTAVE